jgi:hypothetical protein
MVLSKLAITVRDSRTVPNSAAERFGTDPADSWAYPTFARGVNPQARFKTPARLAKEVSLVPPRSAERRVFQPSLVCNCGSGLLILNLLIGRGVP